MTENRSLNVRERIRRFWKPAPEYDHPLTAQERDEDRPATAYDEVARAAQNFLGPDFDPDERRDPA
jgi:hypothetical protein